MGLFSSAPNKKHIELICDIGNGSIGVALVEYAFGNDISNIIFNERMYSHSNQAKDVENIVSYLGRDLNILLSNVFNFCIEKKIKPARASCFYSSPWFVAQTHMLSVVQAEPITFSESVIRKILEEAEKNFLLDVSSVENPIIGDLVLAERRITSTKLNGYHTHNPIGKKATNIEASLFLSAISNDVAILVQHSIDKIWHKILISNHTLSIASFAMFRNEFNTKGSFLIVNVSDNVTDISLVNDEMLLDIISFPLGKRNIIENIEKKCNIDYGLASSLLSMYSKNEIDSESLDKFKLVIDAVKKDWILHFENACNILTKKNILPTAVHLVCDPKFSALFEESIKKSVIGGYSTADREINVYTISQSIFNKYVKYSTLTTRDFLLEIEVLYINLISDRNEKIIANYVLE